MAVLGIDDTAAIVGARCWLEAACFELLGGWVSTVPEPAAKLLLARHSRHHGEHAELLAGVLPATRAHDPARLVAPSDERWVAALAAARGADGDATVERLAGAYQSLLPRLVGDADLLLDETRPWCDGPLARRLLVVLEDERADLAEGLTLLETLLAAGGDPDRVARRRAAVGAALPAR